MNLGKKRNLHADALKAWEALNRLDLESIKRRLADSNSGEGWPAEILDDLETQYKHFLWLLFKYPTESIVPSKEIDAFWHHHILDTRKYARDCAEAFGFFLHHIPSSVKVGEGASEDNRKAFERTKQIYINEFGQVPREMFFTMNGTCCGHTD